MQFSLSSHHGLCIATQILNDLLEEFHHSERLRAEVRVLGELSTRDISKALEFLLVLGISREIPDNEVSI